MSSRSVVPPPGRVLAVLAGGLMTCLAASPAWAKVPHPLPDHWQLRLERLRVIIASENSLIGDGDEPYLVVIGFKSTFNQRGSTQVFWKRSLRELGSGMDRGDEAAIPSDMGRVDFGETDGDYPDVTLLGALVVAMESDNSSFGTVASLFDQVADGIRKLLEDEFESGNSTLLDPAQREEAVRRLRCSMHAGFWDTLGGIAAVDNDDVVAMQTFFYLAAVGDGDEDPVLTHTRPWEHGAVNLAEQTFDLTLNAVRFDGRVPPGTPPRLNCDGQLEEPEGISAFYDVGGRMTSTILRGGWLNQPAAGSSSWHNVGFEYERCPGCHPVSFVFFHAAYDAGDGQGVTDHRLGLGVQDPQQPRKFHFNWNTANLPPQRTEVWAEFVSNSFGGSVLTKRRPININFDGGRPSVTLTSPTNGTYYGTTMRFAASATDTQSGVDHVEYSLVAANGMPFTPGWGTPADGFAVTWNSSAVPEGPATVCAVAVDVQGNQSDTPSCMNDVRIDHTPPAVASIAPSPDGLHPTWILSTVSTILRASVTDPAGVREVVFSAWYTDAAGVYGPHPIGQGVRLATGDYIVSWTVRGIPEQADRGRHRLYVDVTAVDSAGNSGFTTGWLAGFDHTAPTVHVTRPASPVHVSGGALPITVEAADNLGLNNVVEQLTVSARYRETAAGPTLDHTLASLSRVSGWSGGLDLTTLPEQVVTLTATATDAAGNSLFDSQTVTIDRTAPSFSGVGTSPQPFVAGGPLTMSFSYTVSERSSVTIFIRDASRTMVRDLRLADADTSPHVMVWDGTDSQGLLLAGGPYTYTLEARDQAGNTATHPGGSLTLIVDTTPPRVTVASAPDPYRLSGPPLSIRYQQDEAARTEVEILDGASVIRYLGALQSPAGLYSRTWDGRDAHGNLVAAPHAYTIRVRATDLAGNRTVVTAPVSVVP